MTWVTHESKVLDELIYLEICKREYSVYVDQIYRADELRSLPGERWDSERHDEEWREALMDSRESGLITLVFAAMSLEALINRYGVERTSSTHFKNYLDKLDVVSKWLIIPHLSTGKSIETDSQAFEQLRRLYRYRNRVVHYKAIEINSSGASSKSIDDLATEFYDEVKNAIRALFNIPSSLQQLDPDFFKDYDFYNLDSDFNEEFRGIMEED